MASTINDTILVERNVPRTLRMLRQRMADLAIAEGEEELERLESEYSLMADCFLSDMCDPKAADIYAGMLKRTYRLYNTVRLASVMRKRRTLVQAQNIAASRRISQESVLAQLEAFVQDVAMCSLQMDGVQNQTLARLYANHQRYMEGLFNSLLVSGQWTEETAGSYRSLLLSPIVDHTDAQLIVSALTMALLVVFDVEKWLTLVAVYEQSDDVALRQRAIVGLALTMPDEGVVSLFPNVGEALHRLSSTEQVCRELMEVQVQLLYCERTETDSREIQTNIIPTFVKNSRLKNWRMESDSCEDSSLDEILGNEDADSNMAEIEDKMNRMMEMQRKGSDIYFGGFSHMKRFAFFSEISNWFTPFYAEHPDVTNALKGDNAAAIKDMVSRGPFCDSDKYSFVFAIVSIFDRLPADAQEMLKGGSASFPESMAAEIGSPAYVRRMYLQDLYRFFRLFPNRKDFRNPFGKTADGASLGYLFIMNPSLARSMSHEAVEVGRLLFKWRQYDVVVELAESFVKSGAESADLSLLLGNAYLKTGSYDASYELFSRVVAKNERREQAMAGLAEASFMLRRYDDVVGICNRLETAGHLSKRLTIYMSLALINSGDVREGMNRLYRLDYEDGSDRNVKRAIAWGHLMNHKPDEAERIYDALVADGSDVADDLLNCGYAKWLLHRNGEASRMFSHYVSAMETDNKGECLASAFAADMDLLDMYGVGDFEKVIMLESVVKK
ncbi:tetratricopeptide repeat protein [Prevotella sp.]|uniref:tetratricopeptide repeat protein n=1 Tax=Prevotella sp. TaxID=59823 RepID=UPI00307C971B